MNITALIAALVQSGATPEIILAAVKSQDEHKALKRESARQRKIKQREKPIENNSNVTVTTCESRVTECDKVPPSSSLPLLPPTPPNNSNLPSPPSNSSTVTDAREVFEKVEAIIQSPTPLHLAPVVAWLGWGALPETDIYPSAERWKKKNPSKSMNTLEWLSEDVARAIRSRTSPMPEITGRDPPGTGIDEYISQQTERLSKKYAEQPN